MADAEEEAAADEKELSVRDSKELTEEHEAAEADDEVKQDVKSLQESEPAALVVGEPHQGQGETEPQPHNAAAVEGEEEVSEQEERHADNAEEKAEIAEAEDVAADEETFIEKEQVEHEYIHEGDEAKLESLEDVRNIHEEDEARLETLEDSVAQGQVIGDELIQDETVEADVLLSLDQERLEATTPGSEALQEEDQLVTGQDKMTESDEPQFHRTELIEIYYDALAKRNKLQTQNFLVQNKIFEHLRKKKPDEGVDTDKNIAEHEQRYLKFMAQIEDLRKLESAKRDNYHAVIEELKAICMEKKSKAYSERCAFIEFKQSVALRSINSQTGKPVPASDIEQYVDNELRKEQEVVHMRLENIKLKNNMKKNEQQIKLKEQVSEGLHLIDFEQLKIENQTYNEKIEERNEELLKLRKKITSTVQILTHLKEKLQFEQVVNLDKSNELKEVDTSLAQSRDILSRTKQARDSLKIDNNKLRQKCGFLGNESLLRDFEKQKDEGIELQSRLDQLQMKHAELTLHCNRVRQQVEQARQSLA
ncbi:hypothetical protein BsWGS_21193 [Bradybaena similaris]